jgi:pimeloyl-ACP methyl ester carboxylesterase
MSFSIHQAVSVAFLLLWVSIPSNASSAMPVKAVDVNGVQLQYVDLGSGQPIVFVHGTVSDLRAWEPISGKIAENHRFIAYTQRYSGTEPWKDDGKEFSLATHADELVQFISALNTGPVHLVGWSYGGNVATVAAVKNPSLIRSLVLYEPSLSTMLSPDSPEGKKAAADRSKLFGPVVQAAKAGDHVGAAKLLIERVFQLPSGGFDREPQALQKMWLDNARMVPLAYSSPPPPSITCDMLKNFTPPTLLIVGGKTEAYFPIVIEAFQRCMPEAEKVVLSNVNHNAPVHDPDGFSTAVLNFVEKH